MSVEWRTIPAFLDYEASSEGEIRRSQAKQTWRIGRIIQQVRQVTGYCTVNLYRNGVMKCVLAHRQIAESYHGAPPFDGAEAAHDDGVRHHNRPSNLTWKTTVDNAADRIRHGTQLRGESTSLAKLDLNKVREIRRRRADGETLASLSAEFGVSQSQISNVYHRKTWDHVQ